MMAQHASSIVLVAVLLINTLSYCSAENVYCVTPTATSCSSCPNNDHCATLSEYAQEAELYFTSNTTMVFLPGDHVLDRNITVSNVSRLTMHGDSESSSDSTTIVHNGSVGFSFTNMVDFNIYSLAFTSYNRSWSYGSHPASNSALFLKSTQNAKLANCFFHDNVGAALTVHSTNITLTENIEFIHNQCGCESVTVQGLGCGITALNSNLTFIGNTSFHQNTNTSLYCGGAIWASASTLHFTGKNNFTSNSAQNGGAIYAKTDTSLSFNGISNFNNNSAHHKGGAIYTTTNAILSFSGTNIFISNSAQYGGGGAIYTVFNNLLSFTGTSEISHNSGGAIHIQGNCVLTFNGTSNFISNSVSRGHGGVIDARFDTSLSFSGTSNFSHNSAGYRNCAGYKCDSCGGAIYADETTLTFNGTSSFINNSAEAEGGVIHKLHGTLSFIGISSFSHNSAAQGGGAIYTEYSTIIIKGTNKFMGNSAKIGGALLTRYDAVLTFNGISNFFNNSAISGGAVYASARVRKNILLSFIGTSNFIHNSADVGGGAIYAFREVVLNFNGTNNFIGNHGGRSGGAIYITYNISLIFKLINNFVNNSADNGGAIYGETNTSLSFSGISSFSSNSATQGGAIYVKYDSTLILNENMSFINNGHDIDKLGDSHGGALYMAFNSHFSILLNTTVCWMNNHAQLGGAIYVFNINPFIYCTYTASHHSYIPMEKCFFQLQNLTRDIDGVQLIFKNNSAGAAGSVLYGGAIDKCKLTGSQNSGRVFNILAKYQHNNTNSSVSSDPFHICLCKSNHPDCSKSRKSKNPDKTLSIYPGETFQVSVLSTGQRNGIVPAQVRSHMNRGKLLSSQYVQQTTKMCTTLNYTVFSQQNVSLKLYADGPCSTFGDVLILKLNITQTCPPGFNISQEERSCVCDQTLKKYTNNCNITNGLGQITRESDDTFWVGYDQHYRLTIHPYCPFDYCVKNKVIFPLNNMDMQCAHNRSDLLCGACSTKQCNDSGACNSTGYSLVLGSSHCKQCSNVYLLLVIPFALMGVALAFLLLFCKLTVATGTLSGLVFYANIVGVNRAIFLPVKSTDALSVFIAWLNLDFGIETCFYNGLDAYSKTWLQFVFPVYLWLLVGLMILFSHFSQRFAKLLGSNPVSVLATLILLSYAKILRTFITAVYITYLEYPANYNRMVWLHDANIDYLVGKHIPLFLVAMFVFFFLFLPYTLLLLFGQWLQAISHLRFFSWVNSARLKPFMDSYHAPYKPKHRYWPGLLLVLRFVLLLVFALNPQQDTNVSLLAILVGAGILQLWAWASGGVYKNWCLDVLEGSFALNLIVLVGATYCVKLSGGNQLAVGYTSVSIALATFTGILAFHIFQQVRHTKLWKKVPKLNFKVKKLSMKEAENINLENPTNNAKAANFDQLREPWLEDLLLPTHSVV